jgi:hypothetical protein
LRQSHIAICNPLKLRLINVANYAQNPTLQQNPLRNIDSGKRHAYDPDAIARGGVFVVLNHDRTARIERGFARPEDEAPEPEPEAELEGEGYAITEDGDEDRVSASEPAEEDAEEDRKPLSDLLIRDLTVHRTLGLRLALSEQPDIALITVTHTLVAQTSTGRRKPIASISGRRAPISPATRTGSRTPRRPRRWRIVMRPGRRTCRATWRTVCGGIVKAEVARAGARSAVGVDSGAQSLGG